VQKNLAATYRKIVDGGPEVFYEGDIAKAIVAEMERHGGLITREDLAGYEPEWLEPLSLTYRGRYRIATAPPPASSFAGLMKLALMEGYDVAALGHNSPKFLHLYAEAVRLAKFDRMRYSSDPKFVPVPVSRLLSGPYVAEKRREVSPERAVAFEPPKPDMI
jgi:gamma-glutamyltranspeptidase/glutathione hydrolase